MLLADAAEALVIVEHQMAPERSVGSLKQGLVCLPAGKIQASQLRTPSAETLSSELKRRQLWDGQRNLKGHVGKIDVSVCTSWMGLASTRPKGKLSIEVSWIDADVEDIGRTCVASGKIALDGEDPRASEGPMMSAIADSLGNAKQCLATE